jgi:hypothetical protein
LPLALVELNDTTSKFYQAHLKDPGNDRSQNEIYSKLFKDTNYVVTPKEDGRFSIKAKPGDTLYFKAFNHVTQKHAVSDLLKLKNINILLEREPCEEYKPCKQTLPTFTYAFVGERISVNYVREPNYCNMSVMDSKYEAKYRVVKNVYGKYSKDTITFTVYDHYGTPAFSKYEHVLLFVSEYCGKLYHEKYQYFDVYLNGKGKWASPGDPYRLDQNIQDRNVKAEPMTFAADVNFDTKKFVYPGRQPKYEAPYYKINDNTAFPVMGTPVDKLFLIKKEGVLKARGIFK